MPSKARTTKLQPKSGLQLADVADAVEILAVLEGLSVRLAIPRLTQDCLSRLSKLEESLASSVDEPSKWIRIHFQFRMLICHVGAERYLMSRLRALAAVIDTALPAEACHGRIELFRFEHAALVNALRYGDVAGADRITRTHVLADFSERVTLSSQPTNKSMLKNITFAGVGGWLASNEFAG